MGLKGVIRMAENCSGRSAVAQNLRDAGCTEEFVDCFLSALEKGTRESRLCLLCGQRKLLLERVHEAQARLDCLDYLIYQIRK